FSTWMSPKHDKVQSSPLNDFVTAEHKRSDGIRQLGITTDGFVAFPKMSDSGHSVMTGYTGTGDNKVGTSLWAVNYDLSQVVQINGPFSRVGIYPAISDAGPPPKPDETVVFRALEAAPG